LAPSIGRAEKVFELLFFVRVVDPLRRLNLNLRLKHHGVNRFGRWRVADLELKMQQGRQRADTLIHTGDSKV
jgi:hypothetical protein